MNEVTKPDRMRIVFFAPGMPFDAKTVSEKSLGGSESAAFYQARELARRGHEVVVFTSHPQPQSEPGGPVFICHGEMNQQHPLGHNFEHYACNTPHDVLIAQRGAQIYQRQFAAKLCIWQLHDLALFRSANSVLGATWQIDLITVVSDWHAAQVKEVWNINPEVLRVVPNGVDQSLYAAPDALDTAHVQEETFEGNFDCDQRTGFREQEQLPGKNRLLTLPNQKFLLLYQSRPERGLDNALEIMARAEKVGLPVHLLVCAYDNTVSHMQPMYDALYARANSMANVTLLGALTKPELASLQKRCDALLYPTEFEEVSCITAMEAMHAGLPFLSSAHAALPETCADSGSLLLPLKDGKADVEAFLLKLCVWFGDTKPGEYPPILNELRAKQLAAAQTRVWPLAVDRLLAHIAEAQDKRRGSHAAILRHSIEHSDIAFADWYRTRMVVERKIGTEHDRISARTFDEIDRLYAFARDPEAYAAHYAKHQGAYYDGPGATAAGEDVTPSTRYRGVLQCVAEHMNRTSNSALRVLDYGCAHGHYTMPLAKTFNNCDFVGLDISQRAIDAAQGWAKKDGVENADFIVGSQDALKLPPEFLAGEPDDTLGGFDVILAGEVLEHVWDYMALLNGLRGRLRPGGVLIITTPIGRWEHSGTVPFRSAREHLHHFELHDLADITHGHECKVLHAPAVHDRSGFGMSSYVWAVWPKDGLPLWSVNYERKLRQLSTRQTVSACIIAKDAEASLRRCIESCVDWVDEVIVAVDPSTTDGTKQVVSDLARDYPNRPIRWIEGLAAQKDGFDAARNLSIEGAAGDWIMWIDADEELRHPYMMHKFLRPSMHNGYGWPQVHYSVDPEQVLTTDYPCRLFRNNIGVKFYGKVHEHPETELGKAITWSLVRPEMKFLHHGYYDEETRQARFRRNLPLLMQDAKEHPDNRPLNWFLQLRDVAQSIQFDARARGGLTQEHMNQAQAGIKLMERIAELPQPRMIADSMPYYSLCVSSLGIGFDAEITTKTTHPQAPDLAANFNINGRFHSREFYSRLAAKFIQESTKHYEDPHL